MVIVEALRAIADAKGITVAQLALAWVLALGDDIVPIPGTKRRRWLRENIAAADVTLTSADMDALVTAVPLEAVAGDRYHAAAMGALNG